MKRLQRFLWLFLSVFAMCAWAGNPSSPVVMLEQTSDQMIAALKQNHQRIEKEPTYVYTLARRIILPHVDIKTMSRLALGRDNWHQATAAQRKQFSAEFSDLLIRTYATALSAYTDETIKFKPYRGDLNNKRRLQVDSVIYQQGGPAIPVSYRVLLRDNVWKIYDMTVDGVSMIQSFRSQFASTVAQRGMDGLLQDMAKHSTKHN